MWKDQDSQLKVPSIIVLSVYPWSPTPLFYIAPDPRPGSHMVLLSDNPEDHLSPGQCWPSGSPSSDSLRASPVMPSIPQSPSENAALCLEWRRGLHKQDGVEPDFRQQVRYKVEKKGKGIVMGDGGGIKKKWHVKLEYHKTNMGLQGTMSKWVWLIQRKNKIFN